jgi:hypothetical protein
MVITIILVKMIAITTIISSALHIRSVAINYARTTMTTDDEDE